ncbi:MAG: flagellar protein FhlB [Gammaproteobacteria bacterium]|nr:flagellar protein FhlB [Gammaproteobacteria bacterium]
MASSKTLSDQIAISIEYDSSASAPIVTAKGSGYIAEDIINTAKAYGIPIHESPELIEILSQVELNQEIPESLYEAVAQVLIFAYQISGKPLPEQKG